MQVTLLRTLTRVKEFESRHPGAFRAYLWRVLQNEIRDEIRRKGRRPATMQLDENRLDEERGGRTANVDPETLVAYQQALETLEPEDRTAVFLRVEMGFTHQEVAAALDLPTANAARMRVSRLLVRIAEAMDER